MKVYYDKSCNFCKSSIKPFKKNKDLDFYEAISKKTIIVEHNNRTYIKSDAIIELLKTKNKVFVMLKIVPQFIRDWVYDLIARNRHKLK